MGSGGGGCWVVSGSGKGVQNLMRLSLLSIRISAAFFISVIVCPPTLQFVTISFFLKNARANCTFYIYSAKPLSKVHVSNNKSNTDYDPRDIPLQTKLYHYFGIHLMRKPF